MPSGEAEHPITLAFVGYADRTSATAATQFEDEVLALLSDHGAKVLFRGRRREGEPEALPLEVHVLWFPRRSALDAYLDDDRRRRLLERYGDVFARKEAVQVDVVETGLG
jgi:hypothetical protein